MYRQQTLNLPNVCRPASHVRIQLQLSQTIIKHTNNYDHYPVKIDGNTHTENMVIDIYARVENI